MRNTGSKNVTRVTAEVQGLLTYQLIRVGRRLDRVERRIAHGAGLSLIGLKLLFLLHENQPALLSDVIRETSLDLGQASRAVTDLISQGILITEDGSSGTRGKKLLLTEAGLNLLRHCAKLRLSAEESLRQCIRNSDAESFRMLIEEMMDLLADLDAADVLS